MSTGTIILLGAFAGLTIFLGLPLVYLKRIPQSVKFFLNMLATGILLFLFFDVVSKASEPIGTALDEVRTHQAGTGTFLLDVLLLVLGVGLGSVGLVYFNRLVFTRRRTLTVSPALVQVGASSAVATEVAASAVPAELAPRTLALLIATGIGLHNFSEGLAIGQSAATGELQLAIVLIIGFGLHNMTEGFGIAGPLSGQEISWKFLVLLGLIGGGPTFLGTVIGIIFNSPQVFILFLALAAGAIVYVVAELLGQAKRFRSPEIMMWGLLVGFLLGYATDLIVTYGGA
ncbi:MAG TPA: ZIP family metal transporter [Ktedonobacteraceae bacterium]|nr:ZIP family metal transporter [Ktedonobacteraceae bacterium]